jgi:hypothetical protein
MNLELFLAVELDSKLIQHTEYKAMANVDSPFGFRPVRTLGGQFSGAVNMHLVADNLNVANGNSGMFTGDIVIPVAGGGIDGVGAAPTADVLGVFDGCEYTDPTSGKYTYRAYYPDTTNITVGLIRAWVIDDPMVVFECQSDGAFTDADINSNFTLVVTDGNTSDGQSKFELDYSEAATTSTDPIKAIGRSTDEDNSDTSAANGNVYVIINQHTYKSVGTVGI